MEKVQSEVKVRVAGACMSARSYMEKTALPTIAIRTMQDSAQAATPARAI